ncbi:helix-turn-helix transcriptional regulator [Cellulomonas dongxiuzhuiae]|uniref:Helix-turn-helix domain-containing protein n=1 Tax=Cellulomonas dongxiuzhuiae TaxID=2819979 RepID=A0ABX8GN05_9CELL|nr:helix-turn-helix domain-containing protein [Cellulomonas dongxiuzhuiae]MBO3087377.1 helix-turn-helix domain-containing protein [Cellulomonas dongxiuzhuiae]MBO3093226.1 helix-turn-helix domain-containing protein [Cellulomonas dongxiuzhuiae]QWC17514.1 helix-turn-helix domain-containing protein [Cellulomonas dongxiuzhuiae]
MTGPTPVVDRTPDAVSEASTRRRILQIVAADGPVSAADLASALDLAAAGVRRHLQALELADQVAVHRGRAAARGRGRPARRYVVTGQGQTALSHRYAEIAADALGFLARAAGPQAVEQFAEHRVRELEDRHAAAVDAAGPDVAARAEALARALAGDGYAASVRPVPGTSVVQLCQGHCPVQEVAAQFPQLCEAEARAFGRLLGVHVQRLSTLTSGGHVCTTSIPTVPTRAATPGGTGPPDDPVLGGTAETAVPAPTPTPPAPVHSTEGPTR